MFSDIGVTMFSSDIGVTIFSDIGVIIFSSDIGVTIFSDIGVTIFSDISVKKSNSCVLSSTSR